jgi:adenosylmethionine-8-amino-7-oxononanoate aminotransferase
MCLSKGLTAGFLPLAATVSTARVYREFVARDPRRTFFHGHSYSGNPLGCAAANASLRIFESEPVFERIGSIAQIHAQRLARLKEHPAVADVRHIGTVAALELSAHDSGYLSGLRPFLYTFFLDHNLLLRPLGNVVYILPPYVTTSADLDYVYDVIEEALGRLPTSP